ncbi:hypothetical protein FEM48_Zijuj09G0131000 [Ziziphus jujuba var. spinosa]|uniref:PUM-HD domain-containing protein n=1 Tax=Ziziphus jujuba var. spinosa TaxID=714518 RepID=A0A978UT65_ZIZJJ|nr:hypothetical protein FEM48_Zijuj09G0131000 [Ziziphus jujuba var. spinosa]
MIENDYNVNWHMEESPFYPTSSSSGSIINIPVINNFSAGNGGGGSGAVSLSPEIQASQYAVGNNHPMLENNPSFQNPRPPQSRFCQYPTTASSRNNQIDMFDIFSLWNNNNNNNVIDPNLLQQYQQQIMRSSNNGLGLHHETDLESAMSRLTLSTHRQSQFQFQPADYQFLNNIRGLTNNSNPAAGAAYDYFGNSSTSTDLSPEALYRLRIQYASMGLQLPYYNGGIPLTTAGYESLYFPAGLNQYRSRSRLDNGRITTTGLYQTRPSSMVNNNDYDHGLAVGSGISGGGGGLQYRTREISSSNNGFGSGLSEDWKSMYNNHRCFHPRSSSSSRQNMAYSSLEQVRGRMFYVAKDQEGCRFLQTRLVKDKPEEINMIFSEVKDNLHDLMVQQFGNYLIQKLIEVVNANQLSEILVSVISNEQRFKEVCIDEHGTRVVQKLLGYLKVPEQQFLAMSAVSRITVALTKSSNGNHVIQKCFAELSPEVNKPLLDEVAANCLEIATDKSGCCILQTCVSYACAAHHAPQTGEAKKRLLAEIISNAQILSEHPYGNYVVQLIIAPGTLPDILTQLRGKYVSLSMNKHGSNVVEKCLKESKTEQYTSIIVDEIINSPHFLDVLQDPYGNYVAQSALEVSMGRTHSDLVRLILMHEKSLHSHPHGKRVLQQARASKQHRV